MNTFCIKPARDGLIVRDPVTRERLPDGGADKPKTPYWLRRLREGDVVEMPVPPAKTTAQFFDALKAEIVEVAETMKPPAETKPKKPRNRRKPKTTSPAPRADTPNDRPRNKGRNNR